MYYRFGSGIRCRWNAGERTNAGLLPAGWYEAIAENCGVTQLATGGKGFPGQTSRFMVDTVDLARAEEAISHSEASKRREENQKKKLTT